MNEQQLQLAFIQFLAQKTGARTQQELKAAIQQMGEQGLKLAYAEFMLLMQLQQVQAAKFGAKLNYIKRLRGQCADDEELRYYKVGGTLCKKCMKKQQKGGVAPKDAIDEFKSSRKKASNEINSTTNRAAFSKMALAKCGTKLKQACSGIKFKATGGAVSGKKMCSKKK